MTTQAQNFQTAGCSIIIEIYRFHHYWMGTRQTKRTPAIKLGLAKGRIYERDLFGD
jgi:hypothetical protein